MSECIECHKLTMYRIHGYCEECIPEQRDDDNEPDFTLDDLEWSEYPIPCPACSGELGHRINCPHGIAFSKIKEMTT